MKRILFGVCGIGSGHTYRQLPLIEYFAQKHQVLLFAYRDSLRILADRFASHPNIEIVEVAVPYYVGGNTGIDFAASAHGAEEAGVNYAAVNSRALHRAAEFLGKADLVISDYEPVAAQYAYTFDVPLVTIDQQSKYLSGEFAAELHGQAYVDEVMRLRMFFPKAAARIACSFFAVKQSSGAEQVIIVPPVLRSELVKLDKKSVRNRRNILVYFTAQQGLEQDVQVVLEILSRQAAYRFEVFVPAAIGRLRASNNIQVYEHGDSVFEQALGTCAGIISTAGHGLLSEAMFLGVPVLALPLNLYEQQMNAEIVQAHGFGLAAQALDDEALARFLGNIAQYSAAIAADDKVLVRGDGRQAIIDLIEQKFLSAA